MNRVPARPDGLAVVLPDFASYAPRYTLRVSAPRPHGRGESALIVPLVRVRQPGVGWWRFATPEAPLRASRADVRRTPVLAFWCHREASAALQAAGWRYDVSMMVWIAPPAMQQAAIRADLEQIR